jgi:selenide,water dikinase
LPIIDKMAEVNNKVQDFRLLTGYSAETSGGIFCMLKKEKVNDFVNESLEKYGQKVWVIGEVVKGNREVDLRKDKDIINIKDSFLLH